MQKIIYLMLISCGLRLSYSQNLINGTVLNSKNEPVLAQIYISEIEKGTSTNLDGNYTIENIPNGHYNLVCKALGYKITSQHLDLENESLELNFVLENSVIEIEEVIVSTHFHKLQKNNVMHVDRVGLTELKNQGITSLPQGISTLPGVSILETGTGISKPIIRGLSGNRILVYSQGIRLENQQFGDEHGLGVTGNGTRSIEVIKGPASLLYGSDAIGGVLYINPSPFLSTKGQSYSINTTYQTNNQSYDFDFETKQTGEHTQWLLNISRTAQSDYLTGNEIRVTNTRNNNWDIKTGFRYQKSNYKSTLRYNYNQSELGIPEEINTPTLSKTLTIPYQGIDQHILSWENQLILNQSKAILKLGYINNNRKEFEESLNEPELGLKLSTFLYDFKYHLPHINKMEAIIGIQGMAQRNTNFAEEILIPNAKKFDFGLFATTHTHLNKWDIQFGIRYDFRNLHTEKHIIEHHEEHEEDDGHEEEEEEETVLESVNRDFNSLNFSLGTKYALHKNVNVRVNWASGFRAPNLSELTSNGVHHGTNRYEIGNNQLKTEQNNQIDLSVDYTCTDFELYSNLFFNQINSYIFLESQNTFIENTPVFAYQQTNALLYGGEWGIHMHPSFLNGVHLSIEYEMVRAKERRTKANLTLIPADRIKNTIRYEAPTLGPLNKAFVRLSAHTSLHQKRVGLFESATDGYTLWNLGIGSELDMKFLKLDWRIFIHNATNKEYISHLSRLKSDGISNMGRNISIGFDIEL